ncbi:uncharacterized protein LOC143266118 [Megachile rotundata]|uniref:uncharacterized protein LOC143266118 n=1 Tax=Megachile rotundata TaxID=143995 RepID=UPI003FD5A890
MAVELKSLLKQRANVKAQITRLNNSAKKVENLDIPYLELRKQKLEDHYNSFCKIQNQIEEIADSDEQSLVHEEFENLYYECADFINSALHRLNTREPSKVSVNSDSSGSLTPSTSGIIPKIHIQPFDGNYAEWQGFYDTFRSLVHDNKSIPTIHKFHLLKSYLTGSAASVTNSLTASEENYTVAWDLVQKRFNKPRKIIQSHIRAIFDLPEMSKESPSSLRAIAEGAEMHVNALKCLKATTDCNDFLIYIITAKLDKQTRTSWERTLDDDDRPTFNDLLSFLNRYSRDDELIKLPVHTGEVLHKKPIDGRNKFKSRANAFVTTHNANSCPLCKKGHYINQCPILLKQTPRERFNSVKSINLCINCLRDNHSTVKCHASTCQKCNGKHHTLLHFGDDTPVEQIPNSKSNPNNPSPSVALTVYGSSEILLSTARITILGKNNQEHDCRVLLDPGSQSNFMTEKLANSLQLPKLKTNIPVVGVGRQINRSNYSICAQIKSKVTDFSCEANFLTLPVITHRLPSRPVNANSLEIPNEIELADPDFNKPAEIDALLGEYLFYRLLHAEQIRLANQTAILQKTELGWVLSGGVKLNNNSQPFTKCFLAANQLEGQIAKFWELEEHNQKKPVSSEESACETLFSQTTNRDSTGRYIVRLPFNEKRQQLGESHAMALNRFFTLERKLHSNPT